MNKNNRTIAQMKGFIVLNVDFERLSIQVSTTPHADKYDSISYYITAFNCDPVSGLVFDAQFNRYEDVSHIGCSMFDAAAKVHLLLQNPVIVEQNKHVNFILPKNLREFLDDKFTL
ncbi:unnamed protein product [Trichobilharzia regenti]|nr:unnamed protein product [Trichobilharzia regenti]